MNIEILPPQEGNLILRPIHHLQKRSPSRARTPQQLRVGNVHEPQAGVDVTNVPIERQTHALRRHGDTITPLRYRHVDDDGRDEEEDTSDAAATDDEDDHTDEKEIRLVSRSRTRRERRRASPRSTRLNPTPKTPTSKKKAATTQRATPPSTKFQMTSQKSNWNHGSTT